MTTSTCDQCSVQCNPLWTYRDPTIPTEERHRGNGVLEVCADCLYQLGGPDYRGLSIGNVLSEIEGKCKGIINDQLDNLRDAEDEDDERFTYA